MLRMHCKWVDDREVSERPALPTVVLWSIWIAMNKVIFQDIVVSPSQMLHEIKYSYGSLPEYVPSHLFSGRATPELMN